MSIDTAAVEQRGRVIAASPVLAHRMISRFSFEVDELRKLKNTTEYQANSKDVMCKLGLNWADTNSTKNILLKWPSQQDLFVSLTAILEIQSFYELKAEKVTLLNYFFYKFIKAGKVVN